jgi:hypothetical protein
VVCTSWTRGTEARIAAWSPIESIRSVPQPSIRSSSD